MIFIIFYDGLQGLNGSFFFYFLFCRLLELNIIYRLRQLMIVIFSKIFDIKLLADLRLNFSPISRTGTFFRILLDNFQRRNGVEQ